PSRDAGWFADWAQDGMAGRAPASADLVLRTTLDPVLQAAAEARIDAILAGPGAPGGQSPCYAKPRLARKYLTGGAERG
ncbi:MAG: hypothetical protein ING24_04820, partial [Roseomonas sp.]|nr:hypothetical protein [Roseomonas sp.]